MISKNKRAAMEMSVGTIVTIVLVMTVLVLGLVLTRTIFSSSTKAITQVDNQLINEVNKLFSEENLKVVVMPTDASVEIKKGNSKPAGFAFSIYNNREESGEFSYEVEYVRDSCGMGIDGAEELFEFGTFPKGSFNLGSGESLDSPYTIFFKASEGTPLCSVEYLLSVEKDGEPYFSGEQLFVRIK